VDWTDVLQEIVK